MKTSKKFLKYNVENTEILSSVYDQNMFDSVGKLQL